MPAQITREQTVTEIYSRHVDMVYRLCYSFMKNRADTEDMVQETFLKLLASEKVFQSVEHEKAWLIVTASNLCKDSLRKWWRKWEDIQDPSLGLNQSPFEVSEVLTAILALPPRDKTVVYMHYYEGYTAVEIAKILHCPQTTVRSRLMRARKRLKKQLGGAWCG